MGEAIVLHAKVYSFAHRYLAEDLEQYAIAQMKDFFEPFLKHYDIKQMDVKTAFAHGSIDTRVHVEQPSHFNDDSAKVCLLNKALYGLKQAPQIWCLTLGDYLASLNFRISR